MFGLLENVLKAAVPYTSEHLSDILASLEKVVK
jgi:hypothetical protein